MQQDTITQALLDDQTACRHSSNCNPTERAHQSQQRPGQTHVHVNSRRSLLLARKATWMQAPQHRSMHTHHTHIHRSAIIHLRAMHICLGCNNVPCMCACMSCYSSAQLSDSAHFPSSQAHIAATVVVQPQHCTRHAPKQTATLSHKDAALERQCQQQHQQQKQQRAYLQLSTAGASRSEHDNKTSTTLASMHHHLSPRTIHPKYLSATGRRGSPSNPYSGFFSLYFNVICMMRSISVPFSDLHTPAR